VNPAAVRRELFFEIACSSLMSRPNEGSAQNNQTRTEFGSPDRLFHRKTANRWTGTSTAATICAIGRADSDKASHRGEAAALVVADMVNNEIAARSSSLFAAPPVARSEIVTHDLTPSLPQHHCFDRFG